MKFIKLALNLVAVPIILGAFWLLDTQSNMRFFEVIGVGAVVYVLLKYVYRLGNRLFPEDVQTQREHREFIEKVSRRTTL